MKEINLACLGKPFLTNTAHILGGFVKDSIPEKCKCTLTMVKDLARTQFDIEGTQYLIFALKKEAVVNYSPGKTLCF